MILSKGRGVAPSFSSSSVLVTTTARRHFIILVLLLSALAFTCGATAADTQFTDSNDNVARGLVDNAVVAS